MRLWWMTLLACAGPCGGHRLSDPAPHGLSWEQLLGAATRADVRGANAIVAAWSLPDEADWSPVASAVGALQTSQSPEDLSDGLSALTERCRACHERVPPPPPVDHRHAARAAAWSSLFGSPLDPAWAADPHVGAAFSDPDPGVRLAAVVARCPDCHPATPAR